MTTPSLNRPPLFVSGWPSGGPALYTIVWPGDSVPTERQPVSLKITAPNGASVLLKAIDPSEGITYEHMFALFAESGHRTLWVRDWELGTCSSIRKGESLGVCLYSAGRPIDMTPNVAGGTMAGVNGNFLNDHHSSLLSWTSDGPAVVVHSTNGDFLFHAPNVDKHELRVRTMALPSDPRIAAYWQYHQNAVSKAALLLAQQITERLDSDFRTWSDDVTIVAAHHTIQHGETGKEILQNLVKRLECSQSSDALIALFCLLHDQIVESVSVDTAKMFFRALDKLATEQCIYSEMFKLFLDRLGASLELWAAEALHDNHFVQRIESVHRLAATSYWDGIYLTYRANEPGSPSKTATGRNVPDAAKKKSATHKCGRWAGSKKS